MTNISVDSVKVRTLHGAIKKFKVLVQVVFKLSQMIVSSAFVFDPVLLFIRSELASLAPSYRTTLKSCGVSWIGMCPDFAVILVTCQLLCPCVYILCFFPFRAVPGCLGSLGDFKNRISDPIEQGQKHSATKRVLATGRKTVKALVRKISRWFLRRTKALIKEQLPKKDDRVRLLNRTTTKLNHFNHLLDI